MNRIQEQIDRIVKYLPDDRIQFMGYIWPADRIKPSFNNTWHPTIKQCVEYIVGVDLSFYPEFPPGESLTHSSFVLTDMRLDMCACGAFATQKDLDDFVNGRSTGKKCADAIQGYTRGDSFQCLEDLTKLVFQICDDLAKAVRRGGLPEREDNTIPRQAFLEWLDEYMPYDGGSKSPRQRIDPMGDLIKFLLATDQVKMKTNDVILLLENKKIRFDYPSMTKEERIERIHDLHDKGLDDRMIALILDWPSVKNKQRKLTSAKRDVSRLLKK
jgi:hypothetical protein